MQQLYSQIDMLVLANMQRDFLIGFTRMYFFFFRGYLEAYDVIFNELYKWYISLSLSLLQWTIKT